MHTSRSRTRARCGEMGRPMPQRSLPPCGGGTGRGVQQRCFGSYRRFDNSRPAAAAFSSRQEPRLQCFAATPLPVPPPQGAREPCGAHLRTSHDKPCVQRCVHAVAHKGGGNAVALTFATLAMCVRRDDTRVVVRLPINMRWPILRATTRTEIRVSKGERRMSIRFRRMVYVGLACLAVSPAFAQNVSPTIAELATYAGADRTERLIAGAKKEGVVNVYSSVTVDDQKALVNAFEKKYGVKLQFWRSSSESILQRAMVEYRGGRYEVDAVETSAVEMESLHREKLLIEVKSPHLVDIVPAALRPHREWVGDRLNIISAGYNTNLIRKQDAPKSYEDLLDPKWKGKLGIEADDAVWFGALANAMGEEKTVKLFRDLVRTNG